ncbi:MAG: hypothetical protein Q8922_13475, partial [Bacteroidota bacterium]|nr:hypothetical protein [Bacteroidota bacterium]
HLRVVPNYGILSVTQVRERAFMAIFCQDIELNRLSMGYVRRYNHGCGSIAIGQVAVFIINHSVKATSIDTCRQLIS